MGWTALTNNNRALFTRSTHPDTTRSLAQCRPSWCHKWVNQHHEHLAFTAAVHHTQRILPRSMQTTQIISISVLPGNENAWVTDNYLRFPRNQISVCSGQLPQLTMHVYDTTTSWITHTADIRHKEQLCGTCSRHIENEKLNRSHNLIIIN